MASESRKSNPLSQHHFWSSSMIPDALGARTGAFLEPFFPWATIRDLRILNRYRKVLKRFKLSGFLEGLYFSKGVTIVLIVIIELYLLCTFKGHGTATVENGFHNADWLDHRINRVPPSRLFLECCWFTHWFHPQWLVNHLHSKIISHTKIVVDSPPEEP